MNKLFTALTAGIISLCTGWLMPPHSAPMSTMPPILSETSPSPSAMASASPVATTPRPTISATTPFEVVMKDVGEAYMDHFGLTREDFERMKNMGVTAIESNFDICATDEDVRYFLDESKRVGIGVIMTAGAGEAEWGFACDQHSYPEDQKPVWQKAAVINWINKWKSHSAIVAWDTSNEAGTTFPNASEDHKERMITVSQLQEAYKDVKQADPSRPVMIRMIGWYFYDHDSDFFRMGNPFAKGVADIVMVNAYSNVDEYFDDFVKTVTNRAISNIGMIDPHTKLIIALGAWEEGSMWRLPSPSRLEKEIHTVYEYDNILGVAYFKYGARGSEWYLPDDASELIPIIGE